MSAEKTIVRVVQEWIVLAIYGLLGHIPEQFRTQMQTLNVCLGQIESSDTKCQMCLDNVLCIAFRKSIPKDKKESKQRGEKTIFGFGLKTKKSLACFQLVSDAANGILRPIKKKDKSGLVPIVDLPWNTSKTTIYEYRNEGLVEKNLAFLDEESKDFIITWNTWTPEQMTEVAFQLQDLREDGLIL